MTTGVDHLKKENNKSLIAFTLTRAIFTFIYPHLSSCSREKNLSFFLTKTSDFADNVTLMTP
jgi:hypothetical protein